MAKKFRRLKKGNCLLLLVALLLLINMFSGGFFADADEITQREFVTVKVAPGDTLWSLVVDHYQFTGNIRAAIDEVQAINGLSDSMIYTGQTLRIPLN